VLEHGRYVDLSGLVVTLELDDHLIADLDSGPLAQTLVEADQAHARSTRRPSSGTRRRSPGRAPGERALS
jgi:hypothetical protein